MTEEENKKLNDLLMEVGETVPTIMFIGTTKDQKGALLLGSPKEDPKERVEDVAMSVFMMMEERQDAAEIILAAVSEFLMHHPDKQKKMLEALEMMKKPKAQA